MGSAKSRWFSVLEISWLLLLLLASPLRFVDYGKMFRYTDPGTPFSWPDQMMSDVIAIANASGNSSSNCDPMRNFYSGYHPLIEDQNYRISWRWAVISPVLIQEEKWHLHNSDAQIREELYGSTITPDPTLGSSLSMEISYVFFGSSNRTWSCFPGRERRNEDVYDKRRRPWYMALQEENKDLNCTKLDSHMRPWSGSSAMKQLKILIDSGNSMSDPVTAEFNRAPGTSYASVAQEMAAEFSKTLPPEDMVNVFAFKATGAHPLSLQVRGKFHGAKNSNDLAQLPPLSASITNEHDIR